MRVLIDLDGTICELKKPGQNYADVRMNPGAVEKLKALKAAGHYIILQTARHMETCHGDQGQVVAKVGKQTLDWLDRHQVPYDEVYFGKPYAEVYIDDLSFPFRNWDAFNAADLDSSRINVLLTMAGAGSRFVQAGFREPKPLILVRDKTLVEWAMESFDFLRDYRNKVLIFVVLKEHIDKYQIDDKLKKIFGEETVIIAAPGLTRGQAETALLAKSYVNNFQRLFIHNCDTYSESLIWQKINEEDPDGILPCFKSREPHYSYARLDEAGFVAEVAEKRIISEWATSGMYYFKRGMDFISSAEAQMAVGVKDGGEFYVGPCYNELIKSGKRIRIVQTSSNWVMGAPEEYAAFKKHYPGAN